MKKHDSLILTLLLATCAAAQSEPETVVLPKGTEIKLVMAQTLTSKHAYLGERVELKVANDVLVGDALLVPRNTRVLGTVTTGKDKEGSKKNPHQVALQIDYIRLGDRRIALTGEHSNKAKIDKGAAVATTAIFGLTGLSILLENRTGAIVEGTEINALVAEDISLPAISSAPTPASQSPQAASHAPPEPPGPIK